MPNLVPAVRSVSLLAVLVTTAAALVPVTPASATQSSSFGAPPTVINAAPNWVPNPVGNRVEGAPDDNCIATASQPTNWVEVRFSFSIPGGDVIHGIELKVKYFAATTNTVQLTKGGALVGSTRTTPAHLDSSNVSCNGTAFVTAGGPTDLWGTTWSAADLNGGNVGVRLTQVSPEVDIDAFQLIVYHGNSPPIANAGGPYTVAEGGSVALSGAASSDPDIGDTLTYAWDLDNNGSFETPGISPTFSAASLDGPTSRTVKLRVTDSFGATSDATATVNVTNVAPSVAANAATVTANEGTIASNTGTFSDPAPADVVTITASTGTVSQGAGTWSWSAPAGDGPATFSVTITAQDDDGGSRTTSFTVQVLNVPPTVHSVTNSGPIPEGGTATISVVATDAGGDALTYTFNCGNGTVVGPQSSPSAACTYGDDGGFPVSVLVTDDDGASTPGSTVVTVTNVAPTASLDTAGAVAFPGGDAFIGRKGVPQDHAARASDPGSDDLTFDWFAGGAVHTHFNNGVSADPDPSPGPIFPFSAADTATVIFTAPGLYTVTVEVRDDDGGAASDDFPKLVTDDRDCTRSQGFWRHQFLHEQQQIDDATLQAYLDLIDFASSVFSELVPASNLAEAAAVFDPKKGPGNAMRAKATQQALAAWLNFAFGAVGLAELIDSDRDGVPDMDFLTLMQAVEATLLDPAASQAALVLAKDRAEAVNLLDEGTPACR